MSEVNELGARPEGPGSCASTEPVSAVSAASGFDPSRWHVSLQWLLAFVCLGAACTILVFGLNVLMWGAAWFAYMGEPERMPPFPWFLVRFFLALLWMLSAFGACFVFASDSDGRGEADETAKTGSAEGDSAGPSGHRPNGGPNVQ